MEDRRWENIEKFIEESRIYRAQDEVTQRHQLVDIDSIKTKVSFQNGRVFELEKWKEQVVATAKEKGEAKEKYYKFLSVCSTVVAAVAAIVMIFKR